MYYIYLFVAVLYISDLTNVYIQDMRNTYFSRNWFYLRRNLNFPRCLILVFKFSATCHKNLNAQP
jgi:hypothetical protein